MEFSLFWVFVLLKNEENNEDPISTRTIWYAGDDKAEHVCRSSTESKKLRNCLNVICRLS